MRIILNVAEERQKDDMMCLERRSEADVAV